ncbi:hypothetical protein BC629DRAFT_1554178, partial [Irpex lacteus]
MTRGSRALHEPPALSGVRSVYSKCHKAYRVPPASSSSIFEVQTVYIRTHMNHDAMMYDDRIMYEWV